MTSPFPSLLRFYVLSTYGLKGRTGLAKGEARAALDPKARAKAVAKAIGIAALAVLVVADLGVVFFMMNWSMYQALKPSGLQGLLILNAATTATFLVFFFGFATALSTYCMSNAEGLLLAMPVKPAHLLGAKIITVYLSECLLGFLLLGVAFGVYAWGERPGPDFYAFGLLSILALPLVPVALSYLVLVPLMSAARFLRNKNAVMIVGGIVGIAFALVFNFYIQSATSRLADPAWILANYAGPDALVGRIGKAYLPAFLTWKAVIGGWSAGGLAALSNLALGAVAAFLVALLLGKPYAASLSTFGETRLRKLASAKGFIERKVRQRRLGTSLFLREFHLMNREPVYFLNGPGIVLLMPVIIAVALVAQGNQLSTLLEAVNGMGEGPWLMLIAAAFGAFLGSSTSITCTSVSRDAKVLPWIKTLPISMRAYALAKFLHGFLFVAFGALVGALGIGLFIGLGIPDALGAFFIAASVGAFVNIAGLWLDTVNPRTSWDNPTAAMKQNPNSVIVILGAMGLIGGLGALAPRLGLDKAGFLLAYGALPAVLAAAALWFYPAFAEKALAKIETN